MNIYGIVSVDDFYTLLSNMCLFLNELLFFPLNIEYGDECLLSTKLCLRGEQMSVYMRYDADIVYHGIPFITLCISIFFEKIWTPACKYVYNTIKIIYKLIDKLKIDKICMRVLAN